MQQRKVAKATARVSNANTYEAIARELHAMKEREWSAAYAGKWLRMSEANLFPFIGPLPVDSITPPLILDTLRRVEKQGKRE